MEAFAIGEPAEVERASPAIFIKVGCEVVVMSCEGCVLGFSSLINVLVGLFWVKASEYYMPL